jgi:hypothetical protein
MSDVLQIIRNSLEKFRSEHAEYLPDLKYANSLLCFSDYSGEEQQANYYCYSFLIMNGDNVKEWDDSRTLLRKKFIPDGRRISYKNYRDKMSRNFIEPYLEIADNIPGYLISFAIEKDIKTLFENGEKFDLSNPQLKGFEEWSKDTVEKTFRVMHLLSLLISCLSSPGQNLIWITDDDKIAANKNRVIQLTEVFALVVSSYLKYSLGHLRVGTTSVDDGTKLVEDLCAIPDLAAGAYSDQLKKSKSEFNSKIPPVFWINAPIFQEKTNNLSWWLATSKKRLCKLFFRFDYASEIRTDVQFYHFFSPKQ